MDPVVVAVVTTAINGVVQILRYLGIDSKYLAIVSSLAGIVFVAAVTIYPPVTMYLLGFSATGVFALLSNLSKHAGE